MAVTAKQHREKRKALIEKAQAFVQEKEDKESGLMTAEDESTYKSMMSDAQRHLDAAKRTEQLEKIDKSLSESTQSESKITGPDVNNDGASESRKITIRMGNHSNGKPRYIEVDAGRRGSSDYESAMQTYLRTGGTGVSHDRLAVLQSDDDERGGYLTMHEQLATGVLKEVDDLLFIRQYAKVHTMRSGKKLGIRKRNSRLSSFSWGTELSPPNRDTSLKHGKKVLEPHYGTGAVDVSRDLMRNSDLIETEVRSEMARDSGEAQEDAFMFGDGNEKPLGIYVESTDGITSSRDVVSGSNTGFTLDGLLSAKFKLKSQYRNGTRGQARWLFHREALELIAKIKDTTGQPIFRVGAGRQQDGSPPEDMLLGFPVDESERAPNTFTAGNFGGSLQNWSYYEIADALEMDLQILQELLARENQVEFLYRLKTDGMPTLEEAFVRIEIGT